jgi:hypothetical protein
VSRLFRALLLVTDVGFLAYWATTLLHLLPPAWLFSGYGDATVSAWNLSFLPLDLVVSATGLSSLALRRACRHAARAMLSLSLLATSISGLQAISFWAIRGDFDWAWWLPNLFLLGWPLPFLARMVATAHVEPVAAQP